MSATPTQAFELMLQFDGDDEHDMRRGGLFASEAIAQQALEKYTAHQAVTRSIIRPLAVHAVVPPVQGWNATVKLADLSTLNCFELTRPFLEPQVGCDYRSSLAENLNHDRLPEARAWASGATREEAIERVLAKREDALARGFMQVLALFNDIAAQATASVEKERGACPQWEERPPEDNVTWYDLEFEWRRRYREVRGELIEEALSKASG